MNFGSGVQNISLPGELPVYIRPVYQKDAIQPIQKSDYQEQKFYSPEKSEKLIKQAQSFLARGSLVDLRA